MLEEAQPPAQSEPLPEEGDYAPCPEDGEFFVRLFDMLKKRFYGFNPKVCEYTLDFKVC